MKILVFHQFYTRLDEPGISRFNLFAPYWKRAGYDTTVIAGNLNYMTGKRHVAHPSAPGERDHDVRVIRAWSSSFFYRTFFGRLLSYATYFCSAFLAGLFAQKPDRVIASSPPIFIGLVAYLISRIRGVPLILEVRDLWPDEIIELGGLRNKFLVHMSYGLEGFLYRKARRIIVNSPGIGEFLVTRKAVSPERIGVVPNPVEFSSRAWVLRGERSLRESLGWGGDIVLLYSGSMSMVYDFDTLLQVAKTLEHESPAFRFVFLGDGRQKPAMRARVREENIRNVQFLDPVPKNTMFSYLSAADIGIVSLGSMGLLRHVYATKVLDYMSAKKPVIAAMEGVTADLVSLHAKCGVVVPPGNREEIRAAILRLGADVSKRRVMGERGYLFLKEHFSADILAERYLQFLQ